VGKYGSMPDYEEKICEKCRVYVSLNQLSQSIKKEIHVDNLLIKLTAIIGFEFESRSNEQVEVC